MTLKDREIADNVSWEAKFVVPPSSGNLGDWKRIEIPFSDFEPHHSYKMTDNEVLDLTQIHSFGFKIYKT